jgi:modulator of FtsH protease HflC
MQRLVPVALVTLVALVLMSFCVFIVDQRRFGVVFALGEIVSIKDKPGLYFKLPPPFQNVEYFDKRILTIDTVDSDRFITSEKLNVVVDTYVKWRIIDPKRYYTSVSGNETTAADRIQRSLRAELNNEVGKLTVTQVISGERDKLLDIIRVKINEDAKQLGVEIVDIRFKRVDFAPEVSERVFDRMQAERKRVANERRATGSADSEKIRADADKQREIIVAEAYRDAQKMRGEGDGKASATYADAFGRDPEFASFYRSLEAYRGTFKNRDVMVLDPNTDFFKYLRNPSAGSKGK